MQEKPKHIAVIVDGNRRYAKKQGKLPWKGHEAGGEKLKKFIQWCNEEGITELTLYLFSMQNFNRTKEEIAELMKIFNKYLTDLLKKENLKKAQKEGARIRFIGKTELFSEELQEKMKKITEATKENTGKKLNLATAYGGREEITEAMKKIGKKIEKGELKPEEINEETIKENLWLNSEPDLIIRTSGEHRTSNFLPWQSTYSELFFIDKLFPEIEKEDLKQVIKEYMEKRERRYGR
ncbi:di-trans,poly-cis-decaprenylcistransferase [Candidatus Woesearchaeota archaeon ex4484_78]|nr:MAG: di-trans,poly-cis-decaprenylcistransferase [Candidatus Woesearchaeota archaeon ex4484_78]